MEQQGPKHRFFGRRKGKTLTDYRKSLIANDFEHYKIKDPSSFDLTKEPCTEQTIPTTKSMDNKKTETWLEIGFGNGEFISHMAQHHPDITFIGCEPFVNGIAALLSSIEKPINNLKIWDDDARILMDEIPDGSIDRIYLLNPDPWPKTRHIARRFVQVETLNEIARLLKPNGLFTMSTDVPTLATYMFDKTNDHNAFQWLDKSEEDKLIPPSDWPIDKTRYMKKALGGEDIFWLEFKKQY